MYRLHYICSNWPTFSWGALITGIFAHPLDRPVEPNYYGTKRLATRK